MNIFYWNNWCDYDKINEFEIKTIHLLRSNMFENFLILMILFNWKRYYSKINYSEIENSKMLFYN